MTAEKIRKALMPSYLFLCLVLGGSAQGTWANASLQLIALGIIGWAVLDWHWPDDLPARKTGRRLLGLVSLIALLIFVQLIPLPPSLWTSFAGRDTIVDGLTMLGLQPGWMPVSLTPYDTLSSMLSLLPAIGVLAAMFGLRGLSSAWLAVAIVAAAIAGVMLGALQVTSGDPYTSSWYLFRQTNFGVAVGFFANANHMATLLLVSIPMIVALTAAAREKAKEVRLKITVMVIGGVCLALLLVGLVLNGSLAGYGLVLPVLLATGLMVIGRTSPRARQALLLGGLACLGAFAAILFTPLNERLVPQDSMTSVSTRSAMLSNSMLAVREFGAAGSGIGSFRKVYQMFEHPERVDLTFVNHAHNDYAELAVETGLPGVALLLLFLWWWLTAVRSMSRSPAADHFAMAGAIGSATVLVHSLVDFPLRTLAISAVFAACLGLIVVSRRHAREERDLRPTRHVVID